MKFSDIPQFPKSCYEIHVSWRSLEKHISHEIADLSFDMSPDYQRGHVWTEDQQRAYVEYCLKGGESGKLIMTNCPGWMRDFQGPFELVDGKQRINAVLKFLKGKLKVFNGCLVEDIKGLRLSSCNFDWRVFNIEKREDILKLYIDINAGGTPHTQEEIDKVRVMLNKAKSK